MQFVSFVAVLFVATQARTILGYVCPAEYADEKHDRFDWNFFKAVLNSRSTFDNFLSSPFPVKLLLSVLDESIESNSYSKTELSRLFSQLKGDQKSKFFQDTLRKLKEWGYTRINFEIGVSNSVNIDKEYEEKALKTYDTRITRYDLVMKESVQLLYGIIFKNNWQYPFDKSETYNKNFLITKYNIIKASMLHQKNVYNFINSEKLNAKIVRLNYEGFTYSMYIILPNEIEGLQSVIDKIDAGVIRTELSKMVLTKLNLEIPKFTFQYSSNLEENLEMLGVKQIFTSKADIVKLSSPRQLYVSNISQRSGIAITERETAAVAATIQKQPETVSYPGQRINLKIKETSLKDEFIADHPFLFFIKHEETDAIIFAGKVVKPSS